MKYEERYKPLFSENVITSGQLVKIKQNPFRFLMLNLLANIDTGIPVDQVDPSVVPGYEELETYGLVYKHTNEDGQLVYCLTPQGKAVVQRF